jgi:hypothetical protein
VTCSPKSWATRNGRIRWTYDFLRGHCTDGRALRILTLVDEYTRECLAI